MTPRVVFLEPTAGRSSTRAHASIRLGDLVVNRVRLVRDDSGRWHLGLPEWLSDDGRGGKVRVPIVDVTPELQASMLEALLAAYDAGTFERAVAVAVGHLARQADSARAAGDTEVAAVFARLRDGLVAEAR